jgi:hypothetical protein
MSRTTIAAPASRANKGNSSADPLCKAGPSCVTSCVPVATAAITTMVSHRNAPASRPVPTLVVGSSGQTAAVTARMTKPISHGRLHTTACRAEASVCGSNEPDSASTLGAQRTTA